MEITYCIKNFRVFDTNGTTFNLKPITILTGANCAGKSSLVKSLLLLKGFFERYVDKNSCPERIPLSFSDEKVYINGIDNVLNNRSKDNKDVEFSITRKGLSDNVDYLMEMFFSSKDSDMLNDGWLSRIRFSCIIDGKTDVFIDVTVTPEGELSFDVLDLSGNVYLDFCRNLDIATYQDAFRECSGLVEAGFFRDNFPNQSDLDRLDMNFESVLSRIKENPLNESIDFSFQPKYYWEFIKDKDRYYREQDIRSFSCLKTGGVGFEPLDCFNESGILLYLPILQEIGGMNPAEFKVFIDGQKEFDYRCLSVTEQFLLNPKNHQGSIDALMDAVAEAFSQSGEASFESFYKSLESEAISDVGCLSANSKEFGDSFDSNWRNICVNHFSRSGRNAGFIEKIETAMNMLVHLGSTEYYFSQAYPFSESLIARKTVDFYYVYRVLSYLERRRDATDDIKYEDNDISAHYIYKSSKVISWIDPRFEDYIDYPESKVFIKYKQFVTNILSDFLLNKDITGVTSVGSFLCPVLRGYSIYDRSNPLSTILLSYSDAITNLKIKDKSFTPGTFINKWIKETGIGRSVEIDMNDDNTAFRIRIVDKTGKKFSSADYGHGVTQLLSILINIETAIILNIVKDGSNTVTICFEEPEVSLHPSWQSRLAHIFRDAYESYGIHFILETHSEYLTRATQAMVAQECKSESDLKAFPCVVYYMERNGSAYDLEYQLSGRFKRSFGSGFFDEASKSSIKILEREKNLRNGKNV